MAPYSLPDVVAIFCQTLAPSDVPLLMALTYSHGLACASIKVLQVHYRCLHAIIYILMMYLYEYVWW
jgi:hypothetical protein